MRCAMTRFKWLALCLALLLSPFNAPALIVFETYSPYHHILVLDQGGFRTLSFDGSTETRMLLANRLRGHFEYTEYFHMPWLWNHDIKRVAMIGLGGGSTQRSYQFYYTNVIGQVQGWHSELVAALYRTMKEVFPQVYLFPANESQNVVFVATRTAEPFDAARIRREAAALVRAGTVKLPTFSSRIQSFMTH